MNYKLIVAALILLNVVLSTPSSQELELDFIHSRSDTDPVTWNLIEFRCHVLDEDGLPTIPATNALIYYNDVPFPGAFVGSNGIARVTISRNFEGNYTCRLGEVRSSPIRIVARPENSITAESRTFEAMLGSTANLNCSITPGRELSRYHVRWVDASNQSTIFAAIPPVPNALGALKYTINPNSFSLSIRDADFADGAVSYWCLLEVQDFNIGLLPYNQTQRATQRLTVIRNPHITKRLPEMRVLSTEDSSTTFMCEARSSPGRAVIMWKHKGRNVSVTDQKYAINMTNRTERSNDFVVQSFLTILALDAIDSGPVECVAVVQSEDGIEMDESHSELSVIGKHNGFRILQTIHGEKVLVIMTPPQLSLSPLRLNVRFIEVATGNSMPRSYGPFMDEDKISVTLERDFIPYDFFRVEVAFAHKDTVGPYSGNGEKYSKFNKTLLFFIVPLAIIFTLLLIGALVAFIICMHLSKKKNNAERDYTVELNNHDNTSKKLETERENLSTAEKNLKDTEKELEETKEKLIIVNQQVETEKNNHKHTRTRLREKESALDKTEKELVTMRTVLESVRGQLKYKEGELEGFSRLIEHVKGKRIQFDGGPLRSHKDDSSEIDEGYDEECMKLAHECVLIAQRIIEEESN